MRGPSQQLSDRDDRGQCIIAQTKKSGTRDETGGTFHQVKGKIKEIAWKVSMNDDLEAEGKKENKNGKVEEKIGEIKKVVGE